MIGTPPVKHVLIRSRPTRMYVPPILAFDVENNPKTGAFRAAHIFGERKFGRSRSKLEHVDIAFTSRNKLIEYLGHSEKKQVRPFVLVGFNVAYDRAFISECLEPNSVIENNGRFIYGKMKNGIVVKDIFSLLGSSLEEWMNALHMERFGIRKILVEKRPEEWTMEETQERCRNDAAGTYYLAQFLLEKCREYGIPFKSTTAGMAYAHFSTHYLKYYAERPFDNPFNGYERKAYYGGRCEVFTLGIIENEYHYDANSMFPSVMYNNLFPDPASGKYIENGSGWKKDFDNQEYGGIFHVKINSPVRRIPVLPTRIKIDNQRMVIFPAGVFTGWYTKPELQYAIEQGYEVIECYSYIRYHHMIPIFKEYIDFWWKERQKFPKEENLAMNIFCKNMMNSLYGRFGMQLPYYQYFGLLEEYEKELPEEFRIIEYHGQMYVSLSSKEKFDAKGTFPCLPAYVTSYARIEWHKMAARHEQNISYGDTDSGHIGERDVEIEGDDLGEWKLEEFVPTYVHAGQKIHGAAYDKLKRMKGVAKKHTIISQEVDDCGAIDMEVWFEKPSREKEAVFTGVNKCSWHGMVKHIKTNLKKRIWHGKDSMPLEINLEVEDEL